MASIRPGGDEHAEQAHGLLVSGAFDRHLQLMLDLLYRPLQIGSGGGEIVGGDKFGQHAADQRFGIGERVDRHRRFPSPAPGQAIVTPPSTTMTWPVT